MNKTLPFPFLRRAAAIFHLCLIFIAVSTISSQAQGQLPSGTVAGSGSGSYTYSLVFSNATAATSPIASIWYAWIPGFFYLPGTPTSATAPAGWTATVSGSSVQYVANTSAFDITAGHALSGFGYQATFSPTQLASASNSGESVAYSAGLLSAGGQTFVVLPAPAPEPTIPALVILGTTLLYLHRRRQPHSPSA